MCIYVILLLHLNVYVGMFIGHFNSHFYIIGSFWSTQTLNLFPPFSAEKRVQPYPLQLTISHSTLHQSTPFFFPHLPCNPLYSYTPGTSKVEPFLPPETAGYSRSSPAEGEDRFSSNLHHFSPFFFLKLSFSLYNMPKDVLIVGFEFHFVNFHSLFPEKSHPRFRGSKEWVSLVMLCLGSLDLV